MLPIELTQADCSSGSVWFLIMLVMAVCMSIDAALIFGLVEGLATSYVIGLVVFASTFGAVILGTVIELKRLSNG